MLRCKIIYRFDTLGPIYSMHVKTLCLGVLSFGEMAGYDIKKYLEEHFAHFFLAGYGSIYPALAELAREEYVAFEDREQEKRPARKVYKLTQRGRSALIEALHSEEPRHKVRSEFLVLMYFAHLLPPEHVAKVLDSQREQWRQLLAEIEDFDGPQKDSPGVCFTVGYGKAVLNAATDYLDRERAHLVRALERSDSAAPRRPVVQAPVMESEQ